MFIAFGLLAMLVGGGFVGFVLGAIHERDQWLAADAGGILQARALNLRLRYAPRK